MRNNKIFIIVLINSIVIILLIFVFVKQSQENSIVYVDKVRLFEGFRMAKEMKAIGEREFERKRLHVDSLYLVLQKEGEKSNTRLVKQFVEKREELDNFNQTFVLEESAKIWNRINSYTREFSEKKGYKMILGSESNSQVLYADRENDITSELLLYINKKYEGFK